MKYLGAIVLAIFGFIISIGVQILVMIYGWGLEPKSWGWIIPLYIFGQIFALLIMKLGEGVGKN